MLPYTHLRHWHALRRTRSVKMIVVAFAILEAANGVVAFLRNGSSLEDFRALANALPGSGWTWFWAIFCVSLISLIGRRFP